MVMGALKVGDQLIAVIPQQIADELCLVDGSEIDIRPVTKPDADKIQYVTTDEGWQAYENSHVRSGAAYRELAK